MHRATWPSTWQRRLQVTNAQGSVAFNMAAEERRKVLAVASCLAWRCLPWLGKY